MMNRTPVCVFLTGATGFVGGNILSSLCKAHPEVHIKALLRREEDAKELQSVYPNLEPVIGTLADLTLLTSAAAEADFVIHATKEDVPAVLALIDGLSAAFAADPPTPRLISVTGTRSLIDRSLSVTGVEDPDARPWSDVTDIQAILSLPKDRIHAEADQTTVAHSATKGVGTMLISPGQLFGRGKGHLKKESASAAYYAAVKNRDRAFVIGDGSVKWSWSSTGDLGDAVVFLMEQAIFKGRDVRSRVGVNQEGYYFVRTGDVAMKERAEAVSKRLGLGEVESLPVDVVAEIHPFGPIMWGCGATFRPDSLSALGWKPKDVDWRALMEEEGGLRA
jgi:nucleoside-diphosphate-sugar epimerase